VDQLFAGASRIKILLVVTTLEITTGRSRMFKEQFGRLARLIPDVKQLLPGSAQEKT
jgi:hypothetical protein